MLPEKYTTKYQNKRQISNKQEYALKNIRETTRLVNSITINDISCGVVIKEI